MTMNGVSVDFFCAACKALERIHGPRMTGPSMSLEAFRAKLAEAESAFLQLAAAPPKKSVAKKRRVR